MKDIANTRNYGPVVAVITDRHVLDDVDHETVRTRYLEALRETAKVIPLLLPTGLTVDEVLAILRRMNGVLLTGAISNVAPARYGAENTLGFQCDLARDQTAFATIEIALALGIPLLGICRGHQELNVALGGTLDPDISSAPNCMLHTEDHALARDRQYDPTHEISIGAGGFIANCISQIGATKAAVNSLHKQGIAALSPKLSADAYAADGVIEAISVKSAKAFAAAVQWHPEWHHADDEISQAIFQSFGQACAQHQSEREPTS